MQQAMPAQSQDPVGWYTECGPGTTFRVQCYFGPSGYLADVVYRNTIPPTDIAVCNAPQQQLQQSRMVQLELSASDRFLRMLVCQDSVGVYGLAFDTKLGERLKCGVLAHKCTSYSSRSTFPLGGFTGSCAAAGQGHHGPMFTTVTSIFGACWNTQRVPNNTGAHASCPGLCEPPMYRFLGMSQTVTLPATAAVTDGISSSKAASTDDRNSQTSCCAAVCLAVCQPGAGTPGGGQPCVGCAPGYYSAGGTSPCMQCPAGRTTIAPFQSICGELRVRALNAF